VRLIANVVEKDLRRIEPGLKADVVVDAYPGEHFSGRIARLAGARPDDEDRAHRSRDAEPELPFEAGMCEGAVRGRACKNTLVVPTNSVVDVQGKRGVFRPRRATRAARSPSSIPSNPDWATRS
jgi:hypothetical protein